MKWNLVYIPPDAPTIEGGWEAAVTTAKRLQPHMTTGLRLRAAHIDGSCFVTFTRGGEVTGHISPFGRTDAHMTHFINNYERMRGLAASATPNEIIRAFWPVLKGNPRAQMDPARSPAFEAFRPRSARKGCRMRLVNGEVHVRMRHQDLIVGPTHYQVTTDTADSCTRDRVGAYDRKTPDRSHWLASLLTTIYSDLADEGGDFQVL
jgi:hypothetical protein